MSDFEVGKRYRTQCGAVAEILPARLRGTYPIAARLTGVAEVDGVHAYTANGKYFEGIQFDNLDLIPGAIDE